MNVSEAIQLQKDFVAKKYHIYKYDNEKLRESMKVLTEAYTDLEGQYNDLDSCYAELENENYKMSNRIKELKENQPDDQSMILDVELFKEKLNLYGLSSVDLFNFIDDYMRLYNKE